jgi:hypothetical protein
VRNGELSLTGGMAEDAFGALDCDAVVTDAPAARQTAGELVAAGAEVIEAQVADAAEAR